jgi:hypothetical protein
MKRGWLLSLCLAGLAGLAPATFAQNDHVQAGAGLHLGLGDEIYFASGTHHNLRVAFGPYIRF